MLYRKIYIAFYFSIDLTNTAPVVRKKINLSLGKKALGYNYECMRLTSRKYKTLKLVTKIKIPNGRKSESLPTSKENIDSKKEKSLWYERYKSTYIERYY